MRVLSGFVREFNQQIEDLSLKSSSSQLSNFITQRSSHIYQASHSSQTDNA